MARRSRTKCQKSYLTGQDGLVQFRPTGTDICIDDYCPFTGDGSVGNTKITLPCDADFRVGDCLNIEDYEDASIDGAFRRGIDYYVIEAGTWPDGTTDGCGNDISNLPWIVLSLDPIGQGEVPIIPEQNGGILNDDGDFENSDGYLKFTMCEFMTACSVRNFDLQLTRNELDISVLPCEAKPCGTKRAQYKKVMPGYANITGTADVLLNCNQNDIGTRMVASSILDKELTAEVRFFVCTKYDQDGEVDLEESLFLQGNVVVNGIGITINSDDVTIASISFQVSDVKRFMSTNVGGDNIDIDNYEGVCIVCTASSSWDGSVGEITNASGNEICDGNAALSTYDFFQQSSTNYAATAAGVRGQTLCDA